ncbi:MAG: hypothetical protein M4579_006702 [Chaenotheca gracillima]|nr:MAG: hypothetical protein M4579_006702 [Chaenotheca gracillima]
MAFPSPPPPKSKLGVYRPLAPTAALKVSPLCLGAMNFGTAWEGFMGSVGGKKGTFEILDYFYEQGGNFIDTANNYQEEQSEQWLGEWMAERKNRDEIVLATKYTSGFGISNLPKNAVRANFGGNHAKSLHVSLEASLRKLQTSYIDILYVHWWDWTCSVEELCQSLNQVVQAGKVLYLAASDMPAWVVTKFNQYARDHGMRQFSVYQGKWSAANRDFEREIIPMVRAEGMALAPWGALGGGDFKTEAQRKETEGRSSGMKHSEHSAAVSKVLEKIANQKKTIMTSVALAYVLTKAPYVFPIVGGRKIEHLKGNIEALSLELSDEDVAEIDKAYPFDVGFPVNFLGGDKPQDVWLTHMFGQFEYVDRQKPIKPTPPPTSN